MNYFNYFTEIEETFVRRRRRHLLLSPTDWALIESWKDLGIPLHVVLRGIERAFDSHEAKRRSRSVKTLFYCQEEVEAQYDEWLTSQRGASPEVLEAESETESQPRAPVLEHLAHAAGQMREVLAQRSRVRPDAFCETLARAADALDKLADDFARAARPDPQRLEESLSAWETRLDEALLNSLSPNELAQAKTDADKQLRSYRKLMEDEVYAQTAHNLRLKLLRQRHGVPRLSLFYL